MGLRVVCGRFAEVQIKGCRLSGTSWCLALRVLLGRKHCMWIEEPLGTLLWHVLGAWNFPSNAGARPRQLGAPPANFPASPEASRDALYNPVLCELPRAFWPVVISSEAVVRDPCDRLVSEFAWARLQGWYNRLGAFGLSFCMILRCGRFGFWLFR